MIIVTAKVGWPGKQDNTMNCVFPKALWYYLGAHRSFQLPSLNFGFMRISSLVGFLTGCTALFLLQSCGSDNPPSGSKGKESGSATAIEKAAPAANSIQYFFYLESSKSVEAYIAPANTRFHHAVNALQAFLNTHPSRKSFSIREIANMTYDVFPDASNEEVNRYFANLTPKAVEKHAAAAKANQSTSDLSQVIATVLEKTGPNDVSVLVSDCVVDTKNNGNNLASQQSYVQTLMNDQTHKSPLAVLILRDTSEFRNGTYYPPAGGRETLNGYRPYFMILAGQPVVVQQLAAGLAARPPFYAQSVLLGPQAPTPPATLLPPLGGLEYYAADPDGARNLIAKKARLSGPAKNFVLRLEADLSQVAATEADKLDPASYEVTPAHYQLRIEAKPHNNFTHVFTLSSPTLGAAHAVSVKMKNTLPQWIARYSSTHTGPIGGNPDQMDRTYGLQYLINGFADGLNALPYRFEMKPVQVMR